MAIERHVPSLCNYAMFCAGCGHGVLLRLICECLEEFGQEKNTMVFDRESVLRTNYDRDLIDTVNRLCPPMTIDQILKQNATKDKDNKPKHDWMY